MIFGEKGHVENGLFVTGLSWSPVYLLKNDPPIVFEAGFCCAQKLYEEDIKHILEERDPEFLFLTHVHWDHCGSASYFKKIFGNIKICTSLRAKEIMEKQTAVERMRRFSELVIPYVEAINGIEKNFLVKSAFEPFSIDLVLEEKELQIGSLAVQVFSSPGHTRDMLSYYIPQKGILIATEACGVMDRIGQFIPQFLLNFDIYLNSLLKLSQLPVEILCPGHHFVFTGKDVKWFFERSIEATYSFKSKVEKLVKDGFSTEAIVEKIKTDEYDVNPHVKHMKEAYILNLKERVRCIMEKMRFAPNEEI